MLFVLLVVVVWCVLWLMVHGFACCSCALFCVVGKFVVVVLCVVCVVVVCLLLLFVVLFVACVLFVVVCRCVLIALL